MNDLISRQGAIDAVEKESRVDGAYGYMDTKSIVDLLNDLPSVQPKQRYTEKELSVFAHGISLSLLSKRSAQHWQYDEDTATEIEFLERLYDKVSADMKGGQDG